MTPEFSAEELLILIEAMTCDSDKRRRLGLVSARSSMDILFTLKAWRDHQANERYQAAWEPS